MPQLLWRIEGASAEPNHARWSEGLTLHLLFQPLTLILARRESHTRHYLALEGCPQCRPDGCDRVCHRVLFEQFVRTALPGITLVPTSRLLPRPSETRRLLATPRRTDARLLDRAFLEQWEAGRLVTTWSRLEARPQPIRVGALLSVDSSGPDPRAAVRKQGWSASRVQTLLHRGAFGQAVPPAAPIAIRAGQTLLDALRDPHRLFGPGAGVPPACEPRPPQQRQGERLSVVEPPTSLKSSGANAPSAADERPTVAAGEKG